MCGKTPLLSKPLQKRLQQPLGLNQALQLLREGRLPLMQSQQSLQQPQLQRPSPSSRFCTS
jgi:hypothetical protein